MASDNMVDPTNPGTNRTFVTVILKTDLGGGAQLIQNCLVYPNPADGRGPFHVRAYPGGHRLGEDIHDCGPTGARTAASTVRVRLQRNRVGRSDNEGRSLANGVYLYKLDARAVGAGAGQSAGASFRDKFVIYR